MEDSTRTALGYSENTCGGDIWAIPLNPPPQGLRKVNGSAPATWEIISTPLIKCLWYSGHGVVFKWCISQDYLKLVGYCFVDYFTIIQITPSPIALTKETMNLTQVGLDIFSWAAQEKGGHISVKNIKWYLLEFKWYRYGKWRLSENKADIFLNTPEGTQKIERLPPFQSSIIIGVWISPKDSSLTLQP